jgi:hypothetical protein
METTNVYKFAEGTERATIRTGLAPEIFVYKGFEYTVYDRNSFIDSIVKFGDASITVAAFNVDQKTITAIIDVENEDRPHDKITLAMKPTNELARWMVVLNTRMDHRQFVKFLERQKKMKLDSMIAAVKQLKFVTQTTGDFSFDDNNNYSFIFKVGDAEGTARLPQSMDVEFDPILENGILSGAVTFEIELVKPVNEKDRPGIILSSPLLTDLLEAAVKAEIEEVRKALPDYLIMNGAIVR